MGDWGDERGVHGCETVAQPAMLVAGWQLY